MEKAFTEARRTLKWAEGEIGNFQTACASFLATKPNKLLTRRTGQKRSLLVYAKQVEPASEDMRRTAYRVISDLRNALDMATHQASQVLNSKALKHTNFPIGDTRAYLERQLAAANGPWRGIPSQLHGKILSFKPYFGEGKDADGDFLLRALGQLANPNKHQIPLRTVVNVESIGIRNTRGVGFNFRQPGRFIAEDEIEIMEIVPFAAEYDVEAEVEFNIAIGGSDLSSGRPAIDLFKQMAARVEAVISELEDEVVTLLG